MVAYTQRGCVLSEFSVSMNCGGFFRYKTTPPCTPPPIPHLLPPPPPPYPSVQGLKEKKPLLKHSCKEAKAKKTCTREEYTRDIPFLAAASSGLSSHLVLLLALYVLILSRYVSQLRKSTSPPPHTHTPLPTPPLEESQP